MQNNKTYKTFIDNAGRSIYGAVKEETDTTLVVENPVMITVQQQQNGQMAVQLFPLFFAEFINPSEDQSRDSFFTYNKASIAVGTDFEIDPSITDQYDKIVNPVLVPEGQQPTTVDAGSEAEEPEVIKLFDD